MRRSPSSLLAAGRVRGRTAPRRCVGCGAIASLALGWVPVALADPAAIERTIDLDGDGVLESVTIGAPGQISISGPRGGRQTIELGSSGELRGATLSVDGGSPPVVVATVDLGDHQEAIALRWAGDRLSELWRGPVGPVEDGEYQVRVAATASGLMRWQERGDIVGCRDDRPVALFPERWDARAGGFRPVPPDVRIPDDLPIVKAALDRRSGVQGGWYRARSATTQAGATDAAALVAPTALADRDPATAWRADRGGVGASFEFRPALPGARAAALRIAPAASSRGRVARLAVVGRSGGALIDLPAGAGGREYVATLPQPIEGCITVVIVALHRGAPLRPGVALAELAILTDVELSDRGAEPALAAQVATGGLAGDSAARLLANRGAAGARALIDRLAASDDTSRRRIVAALVRLRDPAVVAPLAAALARGELADPVAGAAALMDLAPDGPTALTALLGDAGADEAGRLASARALAGVDPMALAAHVGAGSGGFRAALVELLSAADPVALAAWNASHPSPSAAAADRWRAVGKALRRSRPHPELVAAMLDALDPRAELELRYRLVQAVAAVGDAAALDRLSAALARGGETPRDRALRRVAAHALGTNLAARAALTQLARDRDPGVRLAAVRSLATFPAAATAADDPGLAATDRTLAAILADDRWPEVRRHAAAALALGCERPEVVAALDRAIAGDGDIAVRLEALTALARCPTDDLARRLLALADSGGPIELRDRAVALYAGRPGSAADLLTRLGRWRGQAFSSPDALRLAVRAAVALGALGDREAVSALTRAARDPAFPELRAAAITAIGVLGPPCPADALSLFRSLRGSDQPGVGLAARGALARCAPP